MKKFLYFLFIFIPINDILANNSYELINKIDSEVKLIENKIKNSEFILNDISYKNSNKRFKLYYYNEKIKKITIIRYTSNKRQYWNEFYFCNGLIFVKKSILDFNSEPEDFNFIEKRTKHISQNIYFKKDKIFKVVNSHKAFKNEVPYIELEKEIFKNLNQFSFLSPQFGISHFKILEGKGNSFSNLYILPNKKTKIKLKYYLYDTQCNIIIYSYLGDKLYDLSNSKINKMNTRDLIFDNLTHCFINIETKNAESRWWLKFEFEGEKIEIG